MAFRIPLAIGFAAGYVLGSRAGRQRYEQIARLARRVKDSPSVQGAAGVLQAQADNAIHAVRQAVGSGTNSPLVVSNGHVH